MASSGQARGYQQSGYDQRYQQYTDGYNGYQQPDPRSRAQQYEAQYNSSYDRRQQAAHTQNGQHHDQYRDQATAVYQDYNYDAVSDHQYNTYDSYHGMAQQQPRQYKYDERFHTTSWERQLANERDNRNRPTVGQRIPQASRPGTSASNHRAKERILDKNKPESPKAVAWDNPFGVFPGTKKDMEKKKKVAEESRSQSRADIPSERPSTASSGRMQTAARNTQERPSVDDRRPRTSHDQRPARVLPQNSPMGQMPEDSLPQRGLPPQSHHFLDSSGQKYLQQPGHQTPNHTGLPIRPAPSRSATGPAPTYANEDRGEEVSRQHQRGQSLHDQNYLQPKRQPVQNDYHSVSQRQDGTGDPNPYMAELPSQEVGPRDGHVNRSHGPAELSAPQQQHATHNPYGQEPAHAYATHVSPHSNIRQSLAPDFAAIQPGATENVEKQITLQAQPPDDPGLSQPYRRPTYGDQGPKPVPARPGLTNVPIPTSSTTRQAQSPMDGFDFGLNSTRQTANADEQYPGLHQITSAMHSNKNNSRFPPREESRSQVHGPASTNGFIHSYNRPPAERTRQIVTPQTSSRTPGLHSQLGQPPPSRAEYGFDQYGYPQAQADGYASSQSYQHDGYRNQDMPAMHPSYSEPALAYTGNRREDYSAAGMRPPRNAPTRVGLHPPTSGSVERAQAMQSMSPSETDYRDAHNPPRPRTANSARHYARQYPEEAMLGPPTSNSTLPLNDRSHPPPIRLGLMEERTPVSSQVPAAYPQDVPSQTTQSPSPPRREPPKAAAKVPVTIQELNDLRLAYKDRPNDDKLGLKFAKRLVEAGTVLASEGGKADAKTTARNRERYINDAYRIVKKLVANGAPDAMFYLADCYGQGQLGLEVNPREAFHLYNSAAKVGHAQSAYRVAVCCELGQDAGGGTRRDHLKAVQFYKKAATLGDGPAMFKMGMILLKGLLGQAVNRREGISWLKRAADKADEDNPHALHELAMLYENAQSTDVIIKDERYALQLYTQAANLGYKYAQHRLGTAYEYGTLGVQIDPRMSIAWYSKAAAQGEHQSEFALSGWYLTGSEPLLAQSDTEAYLWARKAAQNGLAKAEYAMGYYSEVGIGCRPDIEEAKKWYFRAAAQSDSRAKERLEEIKRGGAAKRKERISRSNIEKQKGDCVVM